MQKIIKALAEMGEGCKFARDGTGELAILITDEHMPVPPDDTDILMACGCTTKVPPVITFMVNVGETVDGNIYPILYNYWNNPTILASLEVQDTIGIWLNTNPAKGFVVDNGFREFAKLAQKSIGKVPRWTSNAWVDSLAEYVSKYHTVLEIWDDVIRECE